MGARKFHYDVSVRPLSVHTDSQGKERETALREGIMDSLTWAMRFPLAIKGIALVRILNIMFLGKINNYFKALIIISRLSFVLVMLHLTRQITQKDINL